MQAIRRTAHSGKTGNLNDAMDVENITEKEGRYAFVKARESKIGKTAMA